MKKYKTRLIVYLVPGFMAVAFAVMILSMVTDWFSFTDSLEDALKNPAQRTKLDLQGQQHADLPSGIGDFNNLEFLYLFGNRLQTFPPEIGKLKKLKGLYAPQNQLTFLPPQIGELENLEHLELYANKLTSLPPEIGNLRNLARLNLNQNDLRSLPDTIGNLTNLKQLDLRENENLSENEIRKVKNLLPGTTVLSGSLIQAKDFIR